MNWFKRFFKKEKTEFEYITKELIYTYGTKVIVKSGFYKGCKGVVVDFNNGNRSYDRKDPNLTIVTIDHTYGVQIKGVNGPKFIGNYISEELIRGTHK